MSAAPEPESRFVVAQSWWIASELVRRHPGAVIAETHPGDGMYDVLRVQLSREPQIHVMLNRVGAVQLRSDTTYGAIASWHEVFAARNPHAIVKDVEDAAGLPLRSKAPPSTRRGLAYSVIAALLGALVNDRDRWDCRTAFSSPWGQWDKPQPNLAAFPSATRPAEPDYDDPQVWAILRDGDAVAMMSPEEGAVHFQTGQSLDLMKAYTTSRRRIPLVAGAMLDRLL